MLCQDFSTLENFIDKGEIKIRIPEKNDWSIELFFVD